MLKTKLKRFLRKPEVLKATGYKRTQLQEMIDNGEFPRPFKPRDTGRAVVWDEDEVVAYQEARLAKRDAESAK